MTALESAQEVNEVRQEGVGLGWQEGVGLGWQEGVRGAGTYWSRIPQVDNRQVQYARQETWVWKECDLIQGGGVRTGWGVEVSTGVGGGG